MEISGRLSKAYEYEDTLQFLEETVTCYNKMLLDDMRSKAEFQKASDKWDRFKTASMDSLNLRGDYFYFASESKASQSDSVCTSCDSLNSPRLTYNELFYAPITTGPVNFDFSKEEELASIEKPGTWSDSGYSFTKSESDYSCFSSLSFSDSVPQYQEASVVQVKKLCEDEVYDMKKYHHEGSAIGAEVSPGENEHRQVNINRLCEDFSQFRVCKSDSKSSLNFPNFDRKMADIPDQIFKGENFNAEELKILREIVNNPDNEHETTKALSDICRNVPSKRYRLSSKKLKSSFKRFCRKISWSVKVNNKEKKQNKETASNVKSLIFPFRKLSVSSLKEKTENRPKNFQRASSYSSLFGRKGSVFTDEELTPNPVYRSVSLYSLDYSKCLAGEEFSDDYIESELKRQDLKPGNRNIVESRACYSVNNTKDLLSQSDRRKLPSCQSLHEMTSSLKKYRELYRYDCEDAALVAPKRVKVTEQRFALTVKLGK